MKQYLSYDALPKNPVYLGSDDMPGPQNDEVYIYGLMPNDRLFGWWLMGDILTAELWLGLHDEVAA